MTKCLITLSCCCLISSSPARSHPTHSLSVSQLVWTIHFTLSQLAELLLSDWRRRTTDVHVGWFEQRSKSFFFFYGEHRRVLMHARFNSVLWDTSRKAREDSARVQWSQSEVRGDGEAIKRISQNFTSHLWLVVRFFFKNTLPTGLDLQYLNELPSYWGPLLCPERGDRPGVWKSLIPCASSSQVPTDASQGPAEVFNNDLVCRGITIALGHRATVPG